MKTIVILSDVHLKHTEAMNPSYLAVKKLIASIKPEQVILNGDFLDFDYLSSYTAEAPRQRENKRLKKDRDIVITELEFFKKYSKGVVYLEGNHEYRMDKTIDTLPLFEGLIELPELLHLDEMGIEWVPELKQPFRIFEDLYVLHGKRFGKHFASQNLDDFVGVSIISGHTHRIQSFARSNNLTGQVYQGIGSGCLTALHQGYENGRPTGHTQGFVLIEYEDPKHYQVHNIVIKDGHRFIYNGKTYSGL